MANVIYGISKVRSSTIPEKSEFKHYVSVIVPYRNEENTISELLADLKDITYPKDLFEVILVNDHSTDQSEKGVIEFIADKENFYNYSLKEGAGKKAALSIGIEHAKGELILMTDADCSVNKEWISLHVSTYNYFKADLILGAVKLDKKGTFINTLQQFENYALQATTIGTIGLKHPIMSNGANLMVHKDIFKQLNDPFKNKFSSGDDIFLLQKLKKIKSRIAFNNHEGAIVTTKAENKWTDFFMQRLRWLSKAKGYSDFWIKFYGLIIGISNISTIALLILCFIDANLFAYFAFSLFVKALTDILLIFPVLRMFSKKMNFLSVLFSEIAYAFTSILIVLLSLVKKTYWKDRKVNS